MGERVRVRLNFEEENQLREKSKSVHAFPKKLKEIEITNAEVTLRAETLVEIDEEMAEKVLKIMEFMDDLDDVQEVHTNAQFPDNFEPGE